MRSPGPTKTRAERFLSVAEAAEILKVSEITIYRAISADEFPAIKIRGRYVVPAKAVDQLEADALARCAPTEQDDESWSVA